MRPTIVYLHGFRSSPASVKATQLRAAVAALPAAERPLLRVPELDHRPARAMATILAVAAEADGALAFVGSSLGGYYATFAAERLGTCAVLINPAVRPFDDLAPYRGRQVNLHSGTAFDVTDAHFDELRALRVPSITRPERYWLLVATGDDVLDYREAVRFYAGAAQLIVGGGDHAFGGFDAQIPAVLRFCAACRPADFVHRN
jgi:predicted esterase YcpF (UPF0227 family)